MMKSKIVLFLCLTLLAGCQQTNSPSSTTSATPATSSTPGSSSTPDGHVRLLPFTVTMQIKVDGAWTDSIVVKGSSDGRVDVKEKFNEVPQFLQLSADGKLQMGGAATTFELTPEGVVLENAKSSKYRFKTDDTMLYDETPHLARDGDTIKDLAVEDGLFFYHETPMKVTIDGSPEATRTALFVLNSYMRASALAMESDSPDTDPPTQAAPKDEATLESISETSVQSKDEATLEDIGDEFRY